MNTLPADTTDNKGPWAAANGRPTAEDEDRHETPRKIVDKPGAHGAAVNREDGAQVEAAEGEIDHTPQGP